MDVVVKSLQFAQGKQARCRRPARDPVAMP